jgi:outer membrane protein TolC
MTSAKAATSGIESKQKPGGLATPGEPVLREFRRWIQPTVALFCVCLAVTPNASAQQNGTDTQPNATWFKLGGMSKWYEGPAVPPVSVSNSSRLESLVRAGKLYLSLQDAIAAALENNIDIEVQRYTPRLAGIDVARAKSGALIRGFSTSVNPGAAGATPLNQTSTADQPSTTVLQVNSTTAVSNIGPSVTNLDPALIGTAQWGHFTTPESSSFLTGANTLVNQQQIYNLGVQQQFLSGTTASLGLYNTTQNSNSVKNDFNPLTTAYGDLTVTQHLLQGFGFAVNNRYIRIAKNNLQVADLVFKQQVIYTVANVINLYWDLVSFNEDVAVKRQALTLAQKLYDDNRKQVEVGTLAPIEIVRAEAEVASREQDLTVSETNVLEQEIILKNAISRNGVASPTISEVTIVPTDRIRIPDVEQVQPIQDLVEKAIQNRPELSQTQLFLDNSKIALKGTKNSLLPTIDAFVDLRNHAQAGSLSAYPTTSATGQLVPRTTSSVDSFFLGGYGTILGQIFGRNFPDYSAGFNVNIPLRNRAAQADYTTAQLNLRQNELLYQRQINQVRVDVMTALVAVRQARAQYLAAEKTRILQEQTLDAEQKKYALGASTVFLVIQAQRDLATAQGNRVQALAGYARARTQLDLTTGQTLQASNVQLDDARKGTVSVPPTPIPVLDPAPPGAASKVNPSATPVAASR